MSIVLNILGGLLAGLLASYVFWLYLRSQKPRISISSKVIKRPHPYRRNLWEYKFRIRNERNRPALNVRAKADLVNVEPNKLLRGLGLPLTHDEVLVLPPLSREEKLGVHSFTIDVYSLDLRRLAGLGFDETTVSDLSVKIREKTIELEDLLRHFSFLRIDILATDPVSNMSTGFQATYLLHDIKPFHDFVDVELEPAPLSEADGGREEE